MNRRVLAFLVLAATLAPATTAYARVPEKTPKRLLEATVRRTMAGTPFLGAIPSVIVRRAGKIVLEINPSEPLQPASLLKLATTAAAMHLWGPNHRFVTRVVAATGPGTGTINGSITLVGGGDPTLATAVYRRERFVGRPKPDDLHPIPSFKSGSPTIEDLANSIKSAGVRHVTGDLIVDGTLFDEQRTQPGWIPIYLGNDPEVGYLDGLTVNEGFSDPEGHGLLRVPSLSAGAFLKTALAKRGVTVLGKVRAGTAPTGAKPIARVQSPPLSELLFYINHWSINYGAEMLLKNLGAAFGKGGTTAEGTYVVFQTLQKLGIPLDGFHQVDGSGLSILNRVAPATIAAILEYMLTAKGAEGAALRASLPVAGQPGTLFKRMRHTLAAGNLRGKTGTIKGVRALAGWVTPLDGVPVVYVMLFNRVKKPSLVTSPLDFLGITLAHYPAP
ncbi:MAG: D-alanyl-D-alanine carboxypeptidase/D-alanyl-D-alanine-endopeptidase [Actinomycetota bacterium]|nr:D-alanyl-D-alanine carboxypeptidase/D-alanyl-D-alanine-endopeptidase [Actinomycetota bacterium]